MNMSHNMFLTCICQDRCEGGKEEKKVPPLEENIPQTLAFIQDFCEKCSTGPYCSPVLRVASVFSGPAKTSGILERGHSEHTENSVYLTSRREGKALSAVCWAGTDVNTRVHGRRMYSEANVWEMEKSHTKSHRVIHKVTNTHLWLGYPGYGCL